MVRMCGLWYEDLKTKQRTEVPLKSIDIDVNISGFISHVNSTLKYENNEESPIEAVFTFPMDENSAVYKFEAEIEGRKIIAECQEKQQAKQTYDDAIAEGRTALLLEEHHESGDLFKCTVGNLPPKTEATVRFAYVQELQLTPEGTAVEFMLPCVFVPRYRPGSHPATGPSPAGAIPSGIPYKVEFKASVTGPKVKKITSESYQIQVNYGDTETKVSLANEFKFDHDLKLQVEYDNVFKPTTVVQRGKKDQKGILKEDILMLNFMPELKQSDFSSHHEFIFIIDRSGSMQGSNIQNASETLLLLLKALPTGCYFNICCFGSSFDFLFPRSEEYSEKSLKAALDLQQKLNANYGGTEILGPLEAIYKQDLISTHSRQLILLTDGGVSNTHQVVSLVKKNSHSARMFSIGIGQGASTSLVTGIARAGNGKAEFVYGTDRLQAKVMKVLKQAMQGAVREVTLDWSLPPEVKVTAVPEKVPSIFSGDKLIMYAIMKGASDELHGSVTLKGKVGERPLEFELPMSRATVMADSETQPLHRLAAKAQIKLLEDKEVAETAEVDNAVFGKMTSKDLIVMLSTSANIVSRHTSFVGVDKERGEQVKGPMLKTEVPMPVRLSSARGRGRKMCAKRKSHSGIRRKAAAPAMAPASAPPMGFACASVEPGFMDLSGPESTSQQKQGRRDVLGIVQLQGFQGNWELDQSLANILGKSLDELKSSADQQDANVWATILALAWLQVNFAANKDEWDMIEMKANSWLASRDLKGQTTEQLIEKAKKLNLKL